MHIPIIIGVRTRYITYYLKNGATRIFLKNILCSSAHGYINFQHVMYNLVIRLVIFN